MRQLWLVAVLCASFVCMGCGKSEDRRSSEQEQAAARQFNADKIAAARELEERRQRRNEMVAANAEDIRKESKETFKKFEADRPTLAAAEEAKAQEDAVERLRARMSDPPAMQARDVHFNAQRTALCLEVNYREGGKYLGFRKAYITPDITWVEPAPDDVSHRVFELNFARMGCSMPAQK
jgi:type II secretory ATPase GspE/PulE/Tfp pilus assembly ATPase PilB-like protein